MTDDERIVRLAEAIVELAQLRIDAQAFADKVWASLPPGSEAHVWPWSK